MRVKQNPIVKALAALMIIVPLYFLVTNKSDNQTTEQSNTSSTAAGKPAVTENEAIAALGGYLSTVEEEQKKLKQTLSNVVTKDDVAKLISETKTPTGTVNEEALLAKVNSVVEAKTKELQQRLLEQSQVKPNQVGDVNSEIPFSDTFEVNTGNAQLGASASNAGNAGAGDAIQWVYPVGFPVEGEKGAVENFLSTGSNLGRGARSVAESAKESAASATEALKDELKPIPYATIHSDSSIHNATALTALIGRVERKGQTHDPFRFQVILSGDTLMANGHTMPGVANAIVSGVGTGDTAFSCVRGRVTSITFNFEDGRIFNQKGTYERPIAELGDRWGNPCIKGIMVDDVEKYIAAQGLIGGLSSYADTIAKQQQTLTSSGNSTSLSLTGNAGQLAAGSIASGGLEKTGQVLAERFENYYEAVYVPPGEKVSLLFIESVPIDYVPTNRKVSYETRSNPIAYLE